MNKRKSAVDLTDLAIGVLILGIAVTIGIRVLINVRDNQLTSLSSLTASNESTWINSSTDTLTNTWVSGITECFGNYTGSAASSVPANTTITSANYTLSISSVDGTGTLTNSTSDVFPDAACSYNYYNTSSRQDYTLADNAATGLSEYGNWFDIIVIVGVAAVILALIFLAFGRRNTGGSVAY